MTSGSRRALLAGFAAMVGCFGLAARGEESAPWDLGQLMHELSSVRSARARFTEKRFLKMLDRPIESSGTLAYEAPSRLEKHTLLPKRELMLVEQDKVTLETGSRSRRRVLALSDYPALRAFVESMRSTLAGDQATLERFYKVDLVGDPDRWRLKLQPSDTKTKSLVREIRISGRRGEVTGVEVDQADGDRSVMSMVPDDS
jgi:hypothetical protein